MTVRNKRPEVLAEWAEDVEDLQEMMRREKTERHPIGVMLLVKCPNLGEQAVVKIVSVVNEEEETEIIAKWVVAMKRVLTRENVHPVEVIEAHQKEVHSDLAEMVVTAHSEVVVTGMGPLHSVAAAIVTVRRVSGATGTVGIRTEAVMDHRVSAEETVTALQATAVAEIVMDHRVTVAIARPAMGRLSAVIGISVHQLKKK